MAILTLKERFLKEDRMFKINEVVKNSLKLIMGWALSLTVLSSFGELVGPYETVRLNQPSIEERIKSANAQVQASSEISEDIKTLVGQYAETLTKCSVDYESLNQEALVNAFLGVRAYEIAVSDNDQTKQDVFGLMNLINEKPNFLRCFQGDSALSQYQLRHSVTLYFAVQDLKEEITTEEMDRYIENLANFLRIEDSAETVEVVPVRRHL